VKKYFDPYHPAVLHSIRHVADVANRAGKSVSLCGEMAADPINAGLLLGLGIQDLSLSAPYIPPVKQALRNMSRSAARDLAVSVLAMESGVVIRKFLEAIGGEPATV
jgi:phosphotransferase system enzyme I (PtsP)